MSAVVERVEVKERPILFKADMVRAILDGRKTMTRRIAKIPDLVSWQFWSGFWVPENPEDYEIEPGTWMGAIEFDTFDGRQYDERVIGKCPYGKPGDRLWVKENAYISQKHFGYPEDAKHYDYDGDYRVVAYSASMDADGVRCAEDYGVKQRSSMLMPRWASRITLEVTNVRVERLQAITEEDALAEGLYHSQDHISDLFGYEQGKFTNRTALGAFGRLWGSINGKTHPWSSNPWVWVVEFRRFEPAQAPASR